MTIHKVIKLFEGKSDFYANKKVCEYIRSFTVEGREGQENVVAATLEKISRIYGFDPRKCPQIKDEGNGVLRIGQDLKRIIGFNTTEEKRFDFIALDCFRKPGQRRSKDQSKKYAKVARTKRNKNWKVVKRECDL